MKKKENKRKSRKGPSMVYGRNSTILLLAGILLLSLALRTFYLGSIPAGFYIDEIFESYPAYSLMQTGRDLSNRSFPMLFDSVVHTYLEPIYIYSTVISFKFMGVSVFSSRITAAIFGTFTVLAAFLLARRMFNERTGLLVAFLLCVSPWQSFFSRIAFRWITLPFFFVLGVYLLYKGFEEGRKRYILYSAVPFALAFYTYSTARLFVPVFLVLFLLIYRKKALKLKRAIAVGLAIMLFLLLPLLYSFYSNLDGLVKRFNETSIFNPENNVLETTRAYLAGFNIPSFMLENNAFAYSIAFARNYLSHLSPSFLFLDGSQNLRHSVSVFGELYLFELPLILAGIYMFLRKREPKHLLVLMWLLIFSIPADFTSWDIPHSGRAINAIPVFEILAACGFFYLAEMKTKHRSAVMIFIVLIIMLACCNIASYFNYYFKEYPKQTVKAKPDDSAFHTNVGDALSFADGIKDGYNEILLTEKCCNFPNYYIAFFTGQDPSVIQANPNGYYPYQMGKFRYNVNARMYCYDKTRDNSKSLYIIKEDDLSLEEFNAKKVFYNPDGTVAFKAGVCNPLENKMVTEWLLCGPFPNPLNVESVNNTWDVSIDYGLDVDYINESSVLPSEGTPCGVKKWEKYSNQKLIDFNSALKPNSEQEIAYAHTYIYSPSARNVELWYGSDDGVKVFLNGELLQKNHIHRGTVGVTDRVDLRLRPGWNSLLIKIENIAGGWVLYNQMIFPDKNMEGVRISPEAK